MMIGLLLTLALAADGGEAPVDAGAPASRPSLLRSAKVTRNEGCPNVARLTDGVASTDGDVWDSPRAAIFEKNGVLEWDLGGLEAISFFRIQADNNDRYVVSASVDGAAWAPVWVAQPVDLPGVQTRTSPQVQVRARYLRLTAEGGDLMYSVGELEAFDSQAALDGSQLQRISPPPAPPPPPPPPFDTGWLVVLGVASLGVVYVQWVRKLNRRRAHSAQPPPEPPKS